MVYDIIFSFSKGFHLTMSKHLPKRNEEGWTVNDLEWIWHLETQLEKGKITREETDLMENPMEGYTNT